MTTRPTSLTDRTEKHLLLLAGAFLGLYSLAITLSNTVHLRSWQVEYRWYHWVGFIIWLGVVGLVHRELSRRFPERDPFLFPIAGLLSGWGLLTIWRLSNGLGLRQSAWLAVAGMVILLAMRFDSLAPGNRLLTYLRRYKYIWLTCGLLLTAITLFLGTNPTGVGPRLWLGCCGIYFQPSELLKLMFIIYLAAFLADRQAATTVPSQLLPLLKPTLTMTGLALLLLVIQRDLGTAAIFLTLYALIVFAGTGDYRVLLFSLLVMLLALVVGYALFDVVNLRVHAWLNPWLDPSGRSYQIVQSLMAVANGGLIGRGPGMGSPGLVPIAESDFIFSAISEETGLVGALALIGLLGLFASRSIRISLQSRDIFHRLLALGLGVHLIGQSILIIGGNLRLLPLTGVTLPFVSHGGSSLLISYFELLCLILISAQPERTLEFQPDKGKNQIRLNFLLSAGMILCLVGLTLVVGWWGFVRGPDLLTRTDNPRRAIDDLFVKRGAILDRQGQPLAQSTGQPGSYQRIYSYPALSPILGYTHPIYGQSGLETGLDAHLRGLKGYPGLSLWWEHLLYGQLPPGLDVRLSLDRDLQSFADELLGGSPGAVTLLNADSGEILAMASSPSFDSNHLDTEWENLINDPSSPLYDRAGMGLYPPGSILGAFLLAATDQVGSNVFQGSGLEECALAPTAASWQAVISAGCIEPLNQLSQRLNENELINLLDRLGLFAAPALPIETLSIAKPESNAGTLNYLTGSGDSAAGAELKVSPLQMALTAAALSHEGIRPPPLLAIAVNTPQAGWVMLPNESESMTVFPAEQANKTASSLADQELPIWYAVSEVHENEGAPEDAKPGYSWFIGGTLPEWTGAPLSIAVLLEEIDSPRVLEMGKALLQKAMQP